MHHAAQRVFRQRWVAFAATAIATVAILGAARQATQPSTHPAPSHSAVTPVPRTEDWWKQRNESFNQLAKKGDIDLVFFGDSITHAWEAEGKDIWQRRYAARHAANFGIGGDRTQHVLWRLQNGNLGFPADHPPKLVVLMIGTNNSNGEDNTAREIADGITAIVQSLREELPQTKVLLLAIFPRGERPNPQREKNTQASALAAKIADGNMVHFLDIGSKFLDGEGVLSKEIMPDLLHLSPKGYELWAEAIEPKITELMREQKTGGHPPVGSGGR